MIYTIIGILQRDKKVLVTSRPQGKPYSGYWEFPGGKREPGETSFFALQRELQEELGIVVNKANFCFTHRHTYPEKQVTIEVWSVIEYVGEPLGLEKQQLIWLPWVELSSLKLLDANYEIVRRFAER